MNIPPVLNLIDYFRESLRRNSLFLMGTNIISALIGFVFWLIAARYYSAADVGLATAIVSILPFLATLATLGFDISLVRFLPKAENKAQIINNCLTVTTVMAIVVAGIYILGLEAWSPKLLFIRENWLYGIFFILFTAGLTASQLIGQIFIAFRTSHFTFYQSLLLVARPILLIPFAVTGIFGIVHSWGIAVWLMAALGMLFIFLLVPSYRPLPTFRKSVVSGLARFSAGNYVSRLLTMIPNNWMPLIIIAVLSEEASAYFYIPFSFAGILGMIPGAVALSLLAETSNDPSRLRQQVITAAKFIFLLMIPLLVLIILFGRPLLSLYGTDYADNSYSLLWLFSLSWLLNSAVTIYSTILRHYLKVKQLVFISAFYTTSILVVSYVMMKWLGLIGVGIAWISVQSVLFLVLGFKLLKMARIWPGSLRETER